MSLNEFKRDALQFLFDKYLESPTSMYSIDDIAIQHGLDVHEAGGYLLNQGLIKNQQFRPDSFLCSISWAGINVIAPQYVNDNLSKIISILGQLGGQCGIMEILDFEPKDFQRAIVKLSLCGQEHYESNKPFFFK